MTILAFQTGVTGELSIREPRKVTVKIFAEYGNAFLAEDNGNNYPFLCDDDTNKDELGYEDYMVLGVKAPNLVDGGSYYVIREPIIS